MAPFLVPLEERLTKASSGHYGSAKPLFEFSAVAPGVNFCQSAVNRAFL